MKTKHSLLLALFLATALPSMAFQEMQDYRVLFEKAKYTMETKADLKEAITLFESLISTYPDEKEYAAKAQLYIGLCYEKMGLKEAQKAYRKVIDNYPGQVQEIALAKERLNRLLALQDTSPKPDFRQIRIPTELSGTVKLSPDGKILLMGADKKLWALPLEGNLGPGFSGTPVQIDTDGSEVEWTGLFWSYDGKWIAYNEFPETTDSLTDQWICIVPPAGGEPKKVIKTFRGPRTVNYQISISPDANKLAFSSVKDDEQYIYSVSVDGGNPKKLTDMEAREPVFSPDGKLIAFAADRGIGRGEGDLGLWVTPSEGGKPHLVAEARKAINPVWSPDGNMIAYIDEEQPRMFIVRISNTGQAIGPPISIEGPEGTSFIKMIAGWTPDNKMGILLVTEQESAIYTLPVQGGQAAMIQRTPGAFISQPRWSPDGKQVFYSTPPDEGNLEGVPFTWSTLASVPASGGNGITVPADLNEKNIRSFWFGGGNRISPDGTTMIIGAWTPEDLDPDYSFPKARIWKIALDGTGSTQLSKDKGPFIDTDPCWSPDGKRIAFIRHELLNRRANDGMGNESIYILDSSGGEPELLESIPADKGITNLVWSSDGKKLACFIRQFPPPWSYKIYVIDIEKGEAHTVGDIQKGINRGHSELVWSPDSKKIAFNYNHGENRGIRVMTLSDGSVEEINTGLTDLDTIVHLDWAPDGEKVVFIGWKLGKREFWMMENFLPATK